MPSRQGMKIIPTGATSDMNVVSWYARLIIRWHGEAGVRGRLFDGGDDALVARRRRVGVDLFDRASATPRSSPKRSARCANARQHAVAPRAVDVADVDLHHHVARDAVDGARMHVEHADGADGFAAAEFQRRGFDFQRQLRRGQQRVVAVGHVARRRRGRRGPGSARAAPPAPRWP